MEIENFLLTLLGAELYALLRLRKDIIVLAKSQKQRSEKEQESVEKGLLRRLLVDFLLLTPAGAVLFFIILPLFLKFTGFGDVIQSALVGDFRIRLAFYGMAGIVSYDFPFVLVKEIAARIALNTLRELLNLYKPKQEAEQHNTHLNPAPSPDQIEDNGQISL